MHGVPANLDLEPLVGSSLIQIGLGQYQIQLHFAGAGGTTRGSIAIEASWELHGSDGALIDHAQEHFERECYRIHVLLGSDVSAFDIDSPRSFALSFASGHRLTIFDDSQQYESFALHLPGRQSIYV